MDGFLGGPDNHLVRCAANGYTCTGATGLELAWLRYSRLRAELARGVGHNTYGEPAWPNDPLYMFPICILAIGFLGLGLAIGLSSLLAIPVGLSLLPLDEFANRYANPLSRPQTTWLCFTGSHLYTSPVFGRLLPLRCIQLRHDSKAERVGELRTITLLGKLRRHVLMASLLEGGYEE